MTQSGSSFVRGWRFWVLIYLLLLAASHLWRAFNPYTHKPVPGQQTLNVHEVYGDSVMKDHTIRIAYRDEYNGTSNDPPVVLLLHGSPVGGSFMPGILRELAEDHRVIAPTISPKRWSRLPCCLRSGYRSWNCWAAIT